MRASRAQALVLRLRVPARRACLRRRTCACTPAWATSTWSCTATSRRARARTSWCSRRAATTPAPPSTAPSAASCFRRALLHAGCCHACAAVRCLCAACRCQRAGRSQSAITWLIYACAAAGRILQVAVLWCYNLPWHVPSRHNTRCSELLIQASMCRRCGSMHGDGADTHMHAERLSSFVPMRGAAAGRGPDGHRHRRGVNLWEALQGRAGHAADAQRARRAVHGQLGAAHQRLPGAALGSPANSTKVCCLVDAEQRAAQHVPHQHHLCCSSPAEAKSQAEASLHACRVTHCDASVVCSQTKSHAGRGSRPTLVK
jgi:hypothetical protein